MNTIHTMYERHGKAYILFLPRLIILINIMIILSFVNTFTTIRGFNVASAS